jgi:23S rRNA (adenine2503-C2)-methyltransferase
LADHDVASLGLRIADQTKAPIDRARRAAERTFHHAFARDGAGDAPWSDEALAAARVGGWARPAVLPLQPALSLTVAERATSVDGTTRLLLRTWDGELVESVIIPAAAGRRSARTTLCLSSQVGCARACTFCETGSLGLTRHLTAGEIVDQFRIAQRICEHPDRPLDARADPRTSCLREPATAPSTAGSIGGAKRRAAEQPISNIVFMGMGEPLDNFVEVMRAISLLCTQQAFDFAASRITVSTVGCADKIAPFFANTRAELAISFNAATDRQRSQIMPINDRHDMAALKQALAAALPPGRKVLFQYALFAGFNDSLEDADQVARYVAGIPCRINVIPANPGPDPTLATPAMPNIDAFVARLRANGVTTLLRLPRGRDVGGACGQLAGAARDAATWVGPP